MVRITRRQTTFWDLNTDEGSVRVHFFKKKEHRFVSADCDTFEIQSKHPLLLNYSERWSQISLARGSVNPMQLIEGLANAVSTALGHWRSLDEYMNPLCSP